MQPTLRQLVDYAKSTKVFRRNKKDVELIKDISSFIVLLWSFPEKNKRLSILIRRNKP